MIFEVCVIWDGEFYAHESLSIQEAQEWAAQYPSGKGCKVRVWKKNYPKG